VFYLNAKEFINDVCKEIKYEPANKPIAEELKGHIEDIKSEYLCKGATEKEAEEKAVEQMGDAKQIGKWNGILKLSKYAINDMILFCNK